MATASSKSWTTSVVGVIGSAVAGPIGAILGTFLGSLTGNLIPGVEEFVKKVFTNLGAKGVEALSSKVNARLSTEQKVHINHDLQTAFRDALLEAIYDIGGVESFPNLLSKPPRDIPPAIQFFKTNVGHSLIKSNPIIAEQVRTIFNDLVEAINEQLILPLDPPKNLESASVYSYLESKTPLNLSGVFFENNITPFLQKFSSTLVEVPELEAHLRIHIFDRMMIQLNECLKQRTPAWRAFNRLILESLQDEISQVTSSQSAILMRLDQILSPDNPTAMTAWSDTMVTLLTATTQIQHHLDEGFEDLTKRVVSQHHELVSQLNQLNTSADRIETKVDRVLRYISTGQTAVDTEQPTLPLLKPPAPGDPPYKGLQSFSEKDAEWFFGREKLIAKILMRLQGSQFLAVIGASGSGKSSVVRAGIIPVLQGKKQLLEVTGIPHNAQQWPIHVIVPTNHPLDSLAASFCRNTDSLREIKGAIADLNKEPSSFNLLVGKAISRHNADHALLVVDQFEELFTICQDEAERNAFITAIMLSQRAIVIIVLRADFYASCAQYAQLRDAISTNQEFIGAMSEEELRRAIEEPARKGNWRFEPGLVDLMIKDIGNEPGGLPLLSHSLLETWRHRSGRTMTLESYTESGGVRGAIAKTAEMIYNQQLTDQQRLLAQTIFLRLTHLGEGDQYTRRRAEVSEFTSGSAQSSAEAVIQILIEARLITSESGAIQVAHEALIREWPKLRGWLEENREGLRLHRRLTEAALEWNRHGNDEDLLYRGLRLEEALSWVDNPNNHPNNVERSFIVAGKSLKDRQIAEHEAIQKKELEAAQNLAQSEAKRAEEQTLATHQLMKREKSLRKALIGVGLLAVLVTILSLIAFTSMQQAQKDAAESERQSQISFSRELAARSTSSIERDQDLSILLAVEAVIKSRISGIGEIREAQTALYQSLEKGNFDQTLRCHTDRVNLALFSPDNKKISSTSKDGSVCLWDSSGKIIEKLDLGKDEVYTALFSPDSLRLVITGNTPIVKVWKPGSAIVSLVGHTAPVGYAEFSPDGNRIITAGWDNTAKIWTTEGVLISTLTGHTKSLTLARFSPDGKMIVTTGLDNTIRLWKSDGSFVKELTGHTALISSIFFSPDGSQFVSASWDGTARVWAMDGSQLSILTGHTRSINNAIYNKDGSLIVTSSYDNTARIWKTDGTPVTTLRGHTGTVNSAMFSSDGQRIITASNDFTIRLWNLEGVNLAILRGHSNWVSSAIFSSDSKRIVSAGWDSTVRLWNTDALFDSVLEGHTAPVTGVDFNPEGTEFLSSSSDSSIRLWAKDGTLISSFVSEFGPINSATFSPDGNSILLAGTKNTAAIYSRQGKFITTFVGHADMVDVAKFSPDGKIIVTTSKDNTVRIWKTDGTLIAILRDHQDRINSVSFHPSGESFITVSTDGAARIWDLTGKLLQTISTDLPLSSVAFLQDGKSILIGDSTGAIQIFSIEGKLLKKLNGHSDIVTSINLSKNGKFFASTSVDGSIILWKSSGEYLSSLEGHSTWVTSASFSPVGDRMISASWDGTIHMWGIYGDIDDMVTNGLRKVDRKLTDQECVRYLRLTQCP